jgi:hypothetical protein
MKMTKTVSDSSNGERVFPLNKDDLERATRLCTNPETGHILITKENPEGLQEWALDG